MNTLKVTRCGGEGQGSCKRCSDKGRWNRMWMCFLYDIEGYEGCYCADCVKEIQKEVSIYDRNKTLLRPLPQGNK